MLNLSLNHLKPSLEELKEIAKLLVKTEVLNTMKACLKIHN